MYEVHKCIKDNDAKFYKQDHMSYMEVSKPFHVFPKFGLENFDTISNEIESYLVLSFYLSNQLLTGLDI